MTRRETTMAELLESMVEEKLLTLTVAEDDKAELKNNNNKLLTVRII